MVLYSLFAIAATICSWCQCLAKPSNPLKEQLANRANELHIISISQASSEYRSDPVTVDIHIDRKDVNIALFLSASIPVTWELTSNGQTRVSAVVINSKRGQLLGRGFESQAVFDLGRDSTWTKPGCDQFNTGYQRAIERIRQLTGMTPARVHLQCVPEKETWIAIEDSPDNLMSKPFYPKVADLRPKNGSRFVFLSDKRRKKQKELFSFDGPIPKSTSEVSPDIKLYVEMPSASTAYGIGKRGLCKINTDNGKKNWEKITRRTSRWDALAYDSIRQRVLLAGSIPIGKYQFYEYKNGNLRSLAVIEKRPLLALTYSKTEDSLFGIAWDCSTRKLHLIQYDNDGSVLSVKEIKGKVLNNCRSYTSFSSKERDTLYQLADAGPHLAIYQQFTKPNSYVAEAYLYQVDKSSAIATLTWKRVRNKAKKLDPPRLTPKSLLDITPAQFNQYHTDEKNFKEKQKTGSLSIPDVVKGLSHPSQTIRYMAERVIAEYGAKAADAVPFLISVLKTSRPHPNQRKSFQLLEKIGHPAVGPLCNYYPDANAETKRQIENLFGKVGAQPFIVLHPLIKELEAKITNNEPVPYSLIFALGEMGPAAKDAIPLLEKVQSNLPKSKMNKYLNNKIDIALKKIGPESDHDFMYYFYFYGFYYIVYGLAAIILLLFIFQIYRYHSAVIPAIKDYAFIYTIPVTVLANPFWLFVGWFASGSMGFSQKTGTNVSQIEALPLIAILWILAFVRFLGFVYCNTQLRKKIPMGQLLNQFCKNHLVQLPWLFITFLYFQPIEGNIMGFIIVPITLISFFINTPLVLLMHLRAFKKLKSQI